MVMAFVGYSGLAQVVGGCVVALKGQRRFTRVSFRTQFNARSTKPSVKAGGRFCRLELFFALWSCTEGLSFSFWRSLCPFVSAS